MEETNKMFIGKFQEKRLYTKEILGISWIGRSFVFKEKKKCIVNMNAVYMSSFRDTVLNIT